jgi:hypothetical protein
VQTAYVSPIVVAHQLALLATPTITDRPHALPTLSAPSQSGATIRPPRDSFPYALDSSTTSAQTAYVSRLVVAHQPALPAMSTTTSLPLALSTLTLPYSQDIAAHSPRTRLPRSLRLDAPRRLPTNQRLGTSRPPDTLDVTPSFSFGLRPDLRLATTFHRSLLDLRGIPFFILFPLLLFLCLR